MGGASIRAIATSVPGPPRDQRELATFMRDFHAVSGGAARRLDALYRNSAIASRHSCLDDDWSVDGPGAFFPRRPDGRTLMPTTAARMEVYRREAPRLAVAACTRLFDHEDSVRREAVDHLFVVSCTGFHAPGLDVELTETLGLRPDVGRTSIGFQGCQGGLAALRLADTFCRAEPGGTALVVCVELCTIHFQHEPTAENLLANALFADGAAAALVTGAEVAGTSPVLRIEDVATALHVAGRDHMTWRVGDLGFSLELSSRLPRAVTPCARAIVRESLAMSDQDIRDAAFWAVHPGGVAILDRVARALALPADALAPSRDVLNRFGNMSSATVFFVLERVLAADAIVGPGVTMAFGPGLSVEAARLCKVVTS